MQIPLVAGAYADPTGQWRTAYPRNMVPVPEGQGIADGYFLPAEGIVAFTASDGPGIDRGGVVWNDVHYRVMGTSLVRVNSDGSLDTLGDVGAGGIVTFDYSFDRLGIASGGRLYYSNGNGVAQVADPDLGAVVDVQWVDGYWMTTDGKSLVVTDLTDPFSVNPLKYGSSEASPDPVLALWKVRNEIHAINRYTIEVFQNVGGGFFPFQRIPSAFVECGTVGTHAVCLFGDDLALVGGARGEPLGVFLISQGGRVRLSSPEIDRILLEYAEIDLANGLLEYRLDRGRMLLYFHLPDQCLVYDLTSSKVLQKPVWYRLTSGILENARYRGRSFVWAYGRWVCGDPLAPRLGMLAQDRSDHYGEPVGWDLTTPVLYNESRGAVVHELELVSLPGRVAPGATPLVWTSYSLDGETWSQERSTSAGTQGQRQKRIRWLQQGLLRNYRIQRFRGTSDAHLSVTRLEAQLEALSV